MSDYNKIAFTSTYRYERVAIKGHQDFPIGGATLTIHHNLGYRPFVRLFYTFGDGKYFDMFAGVGSFNIDGNGAQVDNINVTTTDLIVVIDGNPTVGTVYYRIYAEPQA